MRRLILVMPLLLLAGCTLLESPAARARRNSPDFKAGYRDGCSSAQNRGADPRADSLVRDEESYRTNPAYHSGWGTGFNGCRVARPGGGPLGPDRGPIPDPGFGGTP